MTSTIGVLALQGAYEAHARALVAAEYRVRLVRSPLDFEALDGLVLPGGESTTQLSLLEALGLTDSLAVFLRSDAPVLATCAGLVLLARDVTNPAQRSFARLDVGVSRNGWGRQQESFEARSDRGVDVVAIRAPRIVRVGRGVAVCDTLGGEPVHVREGRVVGTTFHPELTADASRFYRDAFR